MLQFVVHLLSVVHFCAGLCAECHGIVCRSRALALIGHFNIHAETVKVPVMSCPLPAEHPHPHPLLLSFLRRCGNGLVILSFAIVIFVLLLLLRAAAVAEGDGHLVRSCRSFLVGRSSIRSICCYIAACPSYSACISAAMLVTWANCAVTASKSRHVV